MDKRETKALLKRLRALGYTKRDAKLAVGLLLWTSLSATPAKLTAAE